MGVTFLKRGSDSVKLQEQEKAQQELRKASFGRLWRWFLKEGEEGKLTFVDGQLDSQGFLVPPRVYEHTVMHNGKWTNFVCPEKSDPSLGFKCPICAGGDQPSLVSFFTVIDHRVFVSKKDGKTVTNTRKLLVAKPQSMEMLAKMAIKRDGLAGCTFDVSRNGNKSPNIGNVFDFTEKRSIEECQKLYVEQIQDEKTKKIETRSLFVPADYDNEIECLTPEELIMLGFGNSGVTHMHQPNHASLGSPPVGSTVQDTGQNYEELF